jgi:deazaflavin-dependent oxidoreductase (nitroreductase family)
MLSGGADRSDWVRNLQANPTVTIRIGEERRSAVARVVTEMNEDALARRLLVEK